MKNLCSLTAVLALVACGDNTNDDNPTPDSAQPDTMPPDTMPDGPPGFTKPTPFRIPLAAAGPDQLQSAASAGDDKFYAAGFAAQTVAGPRFVTVVRYHLDGTPDFTFGANGVVTTPIVFVGGADEVDIAVQADGKILVSGTTDSPTIVDDRDVGIARLNTNGTLDTTFNPTGAIPGVAIISLGESGGVNNLRDASRSIAVDANGIYIHGVSRPIGNKADDSGLRTDSDFTVARVTSEGVLDTTFGGTQIAFGVTPLSTAGTPGVFRLDIQEINGTPRAIKTLADGKLMVTGYATTPISGGAGAQAVIFKLNTDGTLDTTWNEATGIFHEAVLATQTEVYNIAVHDNGTFTTAGYGRNAGSINDYVSMKFAITTTGATAARSLTYGTSGVSVFDPSGAMLGSNCRNAIALPEGKTLLTGSTGPSNDPAQDAVFAILDADGVLDTKYGTGIQVFELGTNGNDQFWGGAVSGTKAVVVGYQGGLANQTETQNDDAFAVVFDLQ